MTKYPAAVAILILSLAYPVWPQNTPLTIKHRQATEPAHKSKTSRVKPTSDVGGLSIDISLPAPKHEDDTKPKPYPWRELAAPANIPNWLLLFGAMVAAMVAYRTLKAIKRQADLMNEQSVLEKNKERARLRMEVGSINLDPNPADKNWFEVPWKLSIYGATEAFLEKTECYACVGELYHFSQPENEAIVGFPAVMPAKSAPYEDVAILRKHKGYGTQEDNEELQDVREGRKCIYFVGRIEYINVFDEHWVLSYSKQFRMIDVRDNQFIPAWTDYGSAVANSEFRNPKIPEKAQKG